MTELIDKLMPQGGENPGWMQSKLDDFSKTNKDIDENAFNEILAGIEMEGFRKGLRTGWELCEETRQSM